MTQALGSGQRLYQRARGIIPGGTQLLSKRPEMFLPEQWPAYYSRAKGAEVWDLDGRRYLDVATNGIGATILGFADPDVDTAVRRAIADGQMCTLNCAEEVALAEFLLELHPWAQMVRFARGGGEIMEVGVRIARAATGREKVAFCGYHGWTDWYLAASLAPDDALESHLLAGLEPAGVPRGLAGTLLPFRYNRLDELEAIVASHGRELAAIVMEPARSDGPAPGFLAGVRRLATQTDAILVFDEVTSGFRLNTGGIHLTYGIEPDLAGFAKALGNGYPISALLGRREIMEAAQRSFISSTMWTERVGPTAALATIAKHRDRRVSDHLCAVGREVQGIWREASTAAGLPIRVSGLLPLSHFDFETQEPAVTATLFIQEMLDRGFLAALSFYTTWAHRPEHLAAYRTAVHEVFAILAAAEADGDVRRRLRGPVKHSGFERLA